MAAYILCVNAVIAVLLISLVQSRTLYLELNTPTGEELSFMQRFGYLPSGPSVPGDIDYAYTAQSIAAAVRRLQAFAGLPQTGLLDPRTRSLFNKKRCGVKDIETSAARSRRYVIQQGWNKKSITYKVVNGSSTMEKSKVEEMMAAGLAIWAPHGGLQFLRQDDDSPADIEVTFASGDHGDGFPFDGPGRVVAHAFQPPHGAMHFDDAETWGSDPEEEFDDVTDFFAVAVHEIGHALGLSHSSVQRSVMYPYYQVPVQRLHMDDILAMHELYLKEELTEWGLGTEEPVEPTVPVPRFTKAVDNDVNGANDDVNDDTDEDDDVPDLCFTNYDCIQVMQGLIFVFEEEWVWVMRDRKKIEPHFPRRVHELFIGLPRHVTAVRAAYQTRAGNIRIFSGKRYWEFNRSYRLVRKGTIHEYGLPRRVQELTTVFLSNFNNKTYLIDEERFWRYDEEAGRMDGGYPKDMAAWRQVPYPVDAALIWQGDTYFFRGPRFWRFDNGLVRAHEYYPLPTARVWFPCARANDMDRYVVNDGP